MRKRRAVVFENDIVVMGLLKMFLSLRGYDVLAYQEPVECPVNAGSDVCDMILPCGDIEIVDYSMARMNGLDLIRAQARRHCKLGEKNKALLIGYFDTVKKSDIAAAGCAAFEKPVNFTELARWFDECEARMDLSQGLGTVRSEQRRACNLPATFHTFQTVGLRKGIILNSSASGLCLKITSPLRIHQTLTIRSAGSPNSHSALVRWIKPLGNSSYLAGVMFQNEVLEARPAGQALHP